MVNVNIGVGNWEQEATWGASFRLIGNWTCVDETTWPASAQSVECKSLAVIVMKISSADDEDNRVYHGHDFHSIP